MRIISLIDHSGQLLSLILKNSRPADKVASEYLRSKKYIGSKERKFISETTFYTLRNLRFFSFLCDNLYDKIKNLNLNFEFNSSYPIKANIKHFLTAAFGAFESSFSSRSLKDAALIPNDKDSESAFSEAFTDAFKIALFPYFIDIYKTGISEREMLLKGVNKPEDLKKMLNFIDTFLSFPHEVSEIFHTFENFDEKSLISLADSFRFSAPVCLRVDTTMIDRDSVKNKMNEDGYFCETDPISPVGLLLQERRQIIEYDLYKSGVIEVQDSASQIVSYALAPEKGRLILDACCGAGGKSLHIASLTGDEARIISVDTEFMRLKELIKRSEKSGYKSIHAYIINEKGKLAREDKHSSLFKREAFDYVLVDAPCSGMGTLRRDPMKKYRTTLRLIEKLAVKQLEILEFYSKFVKPGGILVYATCSIMPQENRMVIENFLKQNEDFEADNIYETLKENSIAIPGLKENDFYYTFYPHITKTDGFFVARLRRKQD